LTGVPFFAARGGVPAAAALALLPLCLISADGLRSFSRNLALLIIGFVFWFLSAEMAVVLGSFLVSLYSCRSIGSPLPGAGVTFFAVDQSWRFSALLWSHAKKVTKESSFFSNRTKH
jgi:membrane-bound ClpP family serine protease